MNFYRRIKQVSIKKELMGRLIGFLLATFLMTLSIEVSADPDKHVIPTPEGFDKYLVFVGNGLWRSVDGSVMKDGLIQGDGILFQREIMKRTDEEIEENKNLAIQFIYNRFGIDVIHDDDVYFTGFEIDSGNNSRVYTVSGEDVPPSGWENRMGGWGAVVTNQDGIILGGEFEGTHIPSDSFLVYGDMNVKAERPGMDYEEIIIHYETDTPFVSGLFGGGIVRFKLFNEQYGDGLAVGITDPAFLDDNFLMQQDGRTVFTFPARPIREP